MNALLIAVLAVPAAGAAAVGLLPARLDRAARLLGVAVAAVTLVAAAALYRPGGAWSGYGVEGYDVRPWHSVDVPWVPDLDLRFHLGVDGVSYPLVVLTALLTLLCCAYTLKHVPEPGAGRKLVALLLALQTGVLGVFLALDLLLFFVFFEITLLPMYAVIAVWGGARRRRAARKFVLYTLAGSVLLLLGVLAAGSGAGTLQLTSANFDGGVLVFALFALAFAVKSPLWPLHTWLPDAHTQAPTVGSVMLAGVLLKMGTYGLIRVGLGTAPDGAERLAPVLGVLAVAAIIVGSLVCLAQTELKRLIAYSSVGHMGFVLLGIATGTAAGIEAALIGNVAHGVITGLLFFLAGAIKDRAHTGELAELGGLRETAPRLAGLLGFAAVASLGLPGLAGFWGEAFAVVAAVQVGGPLWTTLGVLAAVGAALTAAYFLRLLRLVTHGPAATPPLAGITRAEWVAWAPLVLLALVLGLAPGLVVDMASGAVDALTGAAR
ncbi:complex I subunit 4 family protein [Spirilliplanes yamanashiensis]|uniref:NADH-quinone oxidoreductase subunit M n=1 Tax=Spirilliplanes yamanashiensis TaxID=42233 RepID=A0A8J3Y9N3_9ACTN|nr:NADH-quinone oxidoreductase subunit M [Spirilliplanes yamanashiensis]MDP9815814.1 NADH-quinone oxidoreductase subunit M [Spirilliplanes yamanashiensis]GIJ04069.1 NADH-quinone oxidoreductase subunit M [Spirilliplanes yamanashiensis]